MQRPAWSASKAPDVPQALAKQRRIKRAMIGQPDRSCIAEDRKTTDANCIAGRAAARAARKKPLAARSLS